MRWTALAVLVAMLPGFAQAPRFEVASVRIFPGKPSDQGRLTISGPRLTIEGYSLLGLLIFAFNVRTYQLPGYESLDHTRYDIVGLAGTGATPTRDEFRQMMQALLADRFQLRVRRETRETPIYALVVGRNGIRFPESSVDGPAQFETHGSAVTRIMPKATMDDVAEQIRNNAGLDRPVLDRTGLSGTYRLRLTYTSENRRTHGPEPDPDEISVFSAVEQLGLRLERAAAPVEVVIVEHVAGPSGN